MNNNEVENWIITKIGKLIIYDWKLMIMYLSISKQTYWDAYSNQDRLYNGDKKIFQKS